MKLLQKSALLAVTGILVVGLSSAAGAVTVVGPTPGQSTAEWYLEYMQQYASSPVYQTLRQAPPAPRPPTVHPPGAQPAPDEAVVPAQPSSGQDAQQWYLDYLRQYQASAPRNASPPSPPPPPAEPGVEPRPMPEPSGLTAEEAQVFRWINEERAKAGRAPVETDPDLVRLARLKAEDIATYDYYGHTSPTYGTPGQMLTAAGYRWSAAEETIAKAGSLYQAHAMLMASSAHRKIILGEQYTRVGIGIARYQDRPGLVLVELLVRPAGT